MDGASRCRTGASGGREDAIGQLLDTEDADVLFVAGVRRTWPVSIRSSM